MSKSFIEFKNKGFWIPDAVISLVARCMEDALERDEEHPDWIKAMREHLHHLALEHYPGWATLPLDEELNNPQRLEEFLHFLDRTIELLRLKGISITALELNHQRDKEFSTKWTNEIKIEKLVYVIGRIRDLINGKDGYDYRENFILTIVDSC